MKPVVKICCFIILLVSTGITGNFFYSERSGIRNLYQQVVVKGKAFASTRPSSVIVFKSGGLTLQGSLYMPDGSGPFPGIVLTHGGARLGRKLSLYRILSRKLAQCGYVVLSFDFRGFGESEDPVKFDSPEDLDFIEDVKQAVSFLLSVKEVDTSKLYLVGHSFGAGVVIPAGINDSRIKKIVSIAPGRRGEELIWPENAPFNQYPQQRLAEDTQIPEIRKLSNEFLHPILRYITIDTILDYPVHPPILLIDGEREDQEDLIFLRELYAEMTRPKAYITIRNADHYFGTLRDDEGLYSIVTYWESIIEELVETIDSWLRDETLPPRSVETHPSPLPGGE